MLFVSEYQFILGKNIKGTLKNEKFRSNAMREEVVGADLCIRPLPEHF